MSGHLQCSQVEEVVVLYISHSKVCSFHTYLPALFAMAEMFCLCSVQYDNHMWLLSTWNAASADEGPNF